MISTLQF